MDVRETVDRKCGDAPGTVTAEDVVMVDGGSEILGMAISIVVCSRPQKFVANVAIASFVQARLLLPCGRDSVSGAKAQTNTRLRVCSC